MKFLDFSTRDHPVARRVYWKLPMLEGMRLTIGRAPQNFVKDDFQNAEKVRGRGVCQFFRCWAKRHLQQAEPLLMQTLSKRCFGSDPDFKSFPEVSPMSGDQRFCPHTPRRPALSFQGNPLTKDELERERDKIINLSWLCQFARFPSPRKWLWMRLGSWIQTCLCFRWWLRQ